MRTHQLNVRKFTGYKDKLIGLIGQQSETLIYFQTRFGVHTFGMKIPILLLVADSQMEIVQCRVVKPRRVAIWNPKYKHVVEIPLKNEEESDNYLYEIGDKLELNFIS